MPKKPAKSAKIVKTKKITAKTRKKEEKFIGHPSIPIAVVGVSALFPGSTEAGGYWRDIINGENMVTTVPESHFFIEDFYDPDMFAPDKTYCRTGAFLSPVEFDPMAFGVPPTNIPATDTSQLLALIVAKQVIEDACKGQFKDMDRSRVSCILGVAAGLELMGEMVGRLARPVQEKALREEGIPEDKVQAICNRITTHYSPWKESTFPGLLGNVVAGRIANHFDIGGTNATSDAACASSFSALSAAINELRLGHSDLVISGGVDTNNDPFLFVSFSKTPALSPTEDCRPFSAKADGMVLGEGIGMVALKRLDDAERDGDHIYAVIKGVGTSSDGTGTSIYAPAAKGQARALRRAYENAGYSPDTVELVEAHGTGTKAGDITEFEGLSMVFNDSERKDRQYCALGSVKSQIGHTKSAAAAAGIIKAILGLHHKILPPTIKVENPDPKLKIEESPFYLNTEARPWTKNISYPRRASVSSFGFGGTNYHVTLEEYSGKGKKAYRKRVVPSELILLSAKDDKALIQLCRTTVDEIEDTENMLTYMARTTQENFDSDLPAKLAVIASDIKDLQKKLNQAAESISQKPDEPFTIPGGLFYAKGAKPGKVAFLFPGQGSQYVGMGADIAMQFSDAQNIWDLTETIQWDENSSGKESPQRLCEKVFPIPVFSDEDRTRLSKELMDTKWSQPSILTTSITMSEILKNLDIKPDFVGGHSLGELSAMYDAGVLNDLPNLLKVCQIRSSLMAKAAEKPGSMTAVVSTVGEIQDLLKKWGTDVVIANHNTPQQIVLSGPTPSIEKVESRLKDEKIRFTRLPVSAAFHSSMMKESCDPFFKSTKKIHFAIPKVPVYSCVEGKPHSKTPEKIRKTLVKQLNHPVRFVEIIQSMYAKGVRTFVEVGPSAVLSGLVGKILKDKDFTTINLDNKKEHGMTSFLKAIGKLIVNGVSADLNYLWKEYETIPDPRERKKPKIPITLMGCNYGRPYPPEGGKAALPAPNPPSSEQKTETPVMKKEVHTPEKEKPVSQFQEPVTGPATMQTSQPPQTGMYDTPTESDMPAMQQPFEDTYSPPAPSIQQSVSPLPARQEEYGSWLDAYQEVQRQTAEAHAVYQQTIADSHMAFLNAVESTNQTLNQMLTGAQLPSNTNNYFPKEISAPATYQAPAVQGQQPAPITQTISEPQMVQSPQTISEKPPVQGVLQPPPQLAQTAPAAQQGSGIPEGIDFKEMLLSIVADKTGYPREILDESMGLEADLGIDSIKRVEILSAVKDESPWLPEVDPSEMGDIETLGDVIGYIEKMAPSIAAGAPQPQPAPVASSSAPVSDIPEGIDFKDMLLTIVADKTGYPKEILDEGMGLEADLGIDSIKRVEILSAVKDESPWLPEVDPNEMGNIETLGDVIGFIEKMSPTLSTPAPQAQVAVAAPAPAGIPQDIDFKEMLLSIVADKTGYPRDILTEDMGLESDLGIDSIKRVEILSAVKDESPWLPEVDPSEMGNIETLGDVIGYIEKMAPAIAAPQVTTASAPSASVPEGVDFKEMLLSIVAEKTGYPRDILTEEMGLESDLGIDSIKRVEILSAVKDESPWLPEVDPSEMGNIETLGDVIGYIEKMAPTIAAPATVAAAPAPAATSLPSRIPHDLDFKEMLLSIVAEKTGYPKDILTEEMGLESDLGIDSIKRVEILSAVKDESPWLPEVDPSEMASIETLGDVIKYIEEMTVELKGPNIDITSADIQTPTPEIVSGAPLGRYAIRSVPAPHSGFSMKGLLSSKQIAVTEDETGVAKELVKKMKERGVNAKVVKKVTENADGLIFLGGLKKINSKKDAIQINKDAFIAANTLANHFTGSGGIFVTVQNTGGDFGLSGNAGDRIFLGGLTGLVKTAAIEWSDASVKSIDIDRGKKSAATLAEIICREIFTGGPEIEVGFQSDGSRNRIESYEADVHEAESNIDNQSVIVASGGARGVTAKTLIKLSEETLCSLVLLGRTPLADEPDFTKNAKTDSDLKRVLLEDAKAKGQKITPQVLGKNASKILAIREINATIDAISATGSKVTYLTVDVTDTKAVSEALKPVRKEWGPITGIIHGAGVLVDKLIAEKTTDQFDLVFKTKVEGLLSLLSATAKDPLNVICLFSSVAARFGNMGQCDYAMANEVLNKVGNAENKMRKGKCNVKSINWGPWDGGMVSPLLKEHLKKKGIPLIPLDVGARNLVEEVREKNPENVEILIGPKPPKGGLSIRTIETGLDITIPVNKIDYPFIDSHRIKDNPVVPVALILEWFTRAAHLLNPDLKVAACKDLRVLKGIQLENFNNLEERLPLNCRQISNGNTSILTLELPGIGGAPHYTATIEMSKEGKRINVTHDRITDKDLDKFTWKTSEIYNELLFHGPDFQVIRNLKGVSATSASAILDGVKKMNWPGDYWKTDAAAIDGGLQLAILWGSHNTGKSSLPTKIGTYHSYCDGPVKGKIRCELTGRITGNQKSVSNILFFDSKDDLIAELIDTELHMLP